MTATDKLTPWTDPLIESNAVILYVTEEVSRQGHNTETLDGIERVGWMLNAWAYALHADGRPKVNDIIVMINRNP